MRPILTTHVGSLPRGNDLVPLLLARDHGQPYDAETFDRQVQTAVNEAVAKQEAAGVSIVSDGELGKVGYSTYIKERLSGFGGNVARKPALDLAEGVGSGYHEEIVQVLSPKGKKVAVRTYIADETFIDDSLCA